MVRGGGEPGLASRKEYHIRRQIAERAVLNEAGSKPGMFIPVTCPACGQAESKDSFRNPVGFSFTVCAVDGTVYMNPAPTSDTLARLYNDESYSEYWSIGHSADPVDFERVDGLIPRPVTSSQRPTLLDVGCATGEFLKLAQNRFECRGVELGADTAALAREAGFEVITGTVADVPGRERFDVVTMLQVIEHIVDPRDALAEIHRLLKPGGILYLNTPCTDSASFKLFRERHMHVSSFGHVSLFTKEGLERLASRCGFEVVEHRYCGGADIALHDLVGYAVAPSRFRHRVAFYSPRMLNTSRLIEGVTFGALTAMLRPRGNESYQWTAWRKAS
jgi:SAM-dependent methyltransferase